MTFSEIFATAGAIITSLGGASVIMFGCSNWLGKVWASRMMEKEKAEYTKDLEAIKNRAAMHSESYKVMLKKSEFIFEKQFEAASAFVGMMVTIKPSENSYVDFEDQFWNDYDAVEERSDTIQRELMIFLKSHGAILEDRTKNLIESCILKAKDKKEAKVAFSDTYSGSDLREIYQTLESVEKELISSFKAQSST